MPSEDKATEQTLLLLEEYKSCDERVGRLDGLMWQTAAIVFPISLAGFAFFGIIPAHSREQFLVILAAGIGSIALLTTWLLLSIRWYGYQKLAFYRMREIEPVLGFWQYRYAAFIRLASSERAIALEEMNQAEQKRFKDLGESYGEFPRFGLGRAIRLITILFILGWIALIVREFLIVF